MSESNIINVGYSALRICEAIARIGYEPFTAIMDLIDNSVTAEARSVKVDLYLRAGKTLKNRNSVSMYRIVDDGRGMDHKEIENAFKLGSDKSYKKNSLSKYGMGLKSAGLSLGSRISIVSKKNGKISDKYSFDLQEIEKADDLVIVREPLSGDLLNDYKDMFSKKSGTVVEVDGCENVNQSSPGSTVGKLKERLGVVYYSFLTNKTRPLSLKVRTNPSGAFGEYEDIVAKDMLFISEAKKNTDWSHDSYDYYSPYLILDDEWDSLRDKNNNPLPPIKIQAVAFPQDRMSEDGSPLTIEQKKVIKGYAVSRDNSGFFIYRNGRLIRWGDSLRKANGSPLIGKDDINLRVRFEIQDVHDDVLHVDVSKQRLEIDDEIMGKLEYIVARAIKIAREIRNECGNKLKQRDGEGRTFSNSVKEVNEDDPQQLGFGEADEETLNRQNARNSSAQEALKELDEADGGKDEPEEFKKVRYSDKVPYGQFWVPYFDSTNGTFVALKKNHPFYEQFIHRLEPSSEERLIVEAIIFASALAENNVYSYETKIAQETIEKVFRRFHSNVNQFLQDWAWENTGQD